jgi:hypothetical protein
VEVQSMEATASAALRACAAHQCGTAVQSGTATRGDTGVSLEVEPSRLVEADPALRRICFGTRKLRLVNFVACVHVLVADTSVRCPRIPPLQLR